VPKRQSGLTKPERLEDQRRRARRKEDRAEKIGHERTRGSLNFEDLHADAVRVEQNAGTPNPLQPKWLKLLRKFVDIGLTFDPDAEMIDIAAPRRGIFLEAEKRARWEIEAGGRGRPGRGGHRIRRVKSEQLSVEALRPRGVR